MTVKQLERMERELAGVGHASVSGPEKITAQIERKLNAFKAANKLLREAESTWNQRLFSEGTAHIEEYRAKAVALFDKALAKWRTDNLEDRRTRLLKGDVGYTSWDLPSEVGESLKRAIGYMKEGSPWSALNAVLHAASYSGYRGTYAGTAPLGPLLKAVRKYAEKTQPEGIGRR